jgi:hypothetical protein
MLPHRLYAFRSLLSRFPGKGYSQGMTIPRGISNRYEQPRLFHSGRSSVTYWPDTERGIKGARGLTLS